MKLPPLEGSWLDLSTTQKEVKGGRRKMSVMRETTFCSIGNLHCKCEWPGDDDDDGGMFLSLIHSDTAWTAHLDRTTLDFGARAAEYEQVTRVIVTS